MGCVHHYEKRWRHDEAWERYDYTYGDEESPLTLVYMNNHWQGQAVGTARQPRMLMEREAD